jgi:hypothetical protein
MTVLGSFIACFDKIEIVQVSNTMSRIFDFSTILSVLAEEKE